MPRGVDVVMPRGGSRVHHRLVVVMGVVAVALGMASFLGPWWVVNTQGNLLGQVDINFTSDFQPLGGTTTTQLSWVCCNPNTTTVVPIDYHNASSTGPVFTAASWEATLSILSGAAMTLMAAMSGSSFYSRRLAPILGVLAFLLLLTAPLGVMLQLPGAARQDDIVPGSVAGFWGSAFVTAPHFGGTVTFGAGWAWYAALAAALLFLMAGIVLLRAKMLSAVQSAPAEPKQS